MMSDIALTKPIPSGGAKIHNANGSGFDHKDNR
jgi:hypothetical protein